MTRTLFGPILRAVGFGDAAGEFIGFTPKGKPVFSIAGGAITTADVDAWIPIEYDSSVVMRVRSESAVERYAQPTPMKSKTKEIARSGGMKTYAGETYADDDSANDKVVLKARRFIARFSIDEDDLADAESRMDVIGTKGEEWASSYADLFDNACLGVSAAEDVSSATGYAAPFNSAYYVLRQADASSGYTADDNYLTWDDDLTASNVAGNLYDQLSAALGLVEKGKYWNAADMVCIAHPGWREQLRNAKDGDGKPIFTDNRGNMPGNTTPDQVFGIPIAWSRGCLVTGNNANFGKGTEAGGNQLLYFLNKQYLKLGKRSGPETAFSKSRPQDDNDDASVKFRTRRAFVLSRPQAAAVVERISDV